jgi:hypothetical protein
VCWVLHRDSRQYRSRKQTNAHPTRHPGSRSEA